jgi:hypothetical protein
MSKQTDRQLVENHIKNVGKLKSSGKFPTEIELVKLYLTKITKAGDLGLFSNFANDSDREIMSVLYVR